MGQEERTLDADVIAGSDLAGFVVAAELAEANKRVIISYRAHEVLTAGGSQGKLVS